MGKTDTQEDQISLYPEAVNSYDSTGKSEEILEHLRAWHRTLSDQIVDANRELAMLFAQGKGKADEAVIIQKLLAKVHTRRSEVEKNIEEEKKELEYFRSLHKQSRVEVETIDEPTEQGLIRVRHPNRDFFLADMFDYALKDDGASMEAPIFTLSTKPDLSIWEWRSKDGNKYVKVTPSVLGRATQHDKDVLIYVVSQMTEALNRGREDAKNRTIRFTVHDFLVTTNRQTSGEGYKLLHQAFERLRGTSVSTDIRTGGTRVREGFGIIDRWKIIEKSRTDERMIAVEVTLSDWLFNAVQAYEVLTIHPDYFRLRKPMARRLYEIARKHCGRQSQWVISLRLLQEKTGSKSTLKEFRSAIRAIQADNSLPEYSLYLEETNDKVVFTARNAGQLSQNLIKDMANGPA
ncbi:replication initiator protein A [Advenella incenata]|uniref:Replication initiator protein A n=1 Tax=Advenella incenata TaxID=267800 RepID=A0A4Q7V676_9BURK|nr:replication initiator protein A [Advenella incenata]RZT91037.1 replication initiator protein A [Advenella incenata]